MSEETNLVVSEATPADAAESSTPEATSAEVTQSSTPEATSTEVTEDVIAEATGTEVSAAEASKAEAPSSPATSTDDDSSRVVRMLSVGQQVTGVVKRISEFGAFVDIGVGRDGLVHISELSARRVAKVTDVLQQGAEATFWIKKLDRDRNRISLTMIEPGTKTIRNMEKGDVVQGTVTRIMPYGAFVDIGIGRDALLHVREMGERYVAKPEDVVQVGDLLDARIIDISRRRARVDLSIKGLRPEPEPEPEPEQVEAPKAAPAPQPEPEIVDPYADVEVLSPFAAALRRAEEASGTRIGNRKEQKKNRKHDNRSRELQEDIISRTLGGNR